MTQQAATRTGWGRRLLHLVTCPNCWHTFHPEEVLFVSRHPDLLGDPVLGQEEYLRFLPTHFTVAGEAVDPKGLVTSDLACPRCHLSIPEPMLELPPLFISLVGSPASGKSYFLTTMVWELRRVLPQARMVFSDADPAANSPIHEYEQTLFMTPAPDQPTEIRKTQTNDSQLYRTSRISDATIRFPVPLQFSLQAMPSHPRFGRGHVGRIVVLYDNAGEDFLPGGGDQAGSATVLHLAKSQIILTLFDPTQEPRFRSFCKKDDPQITMGLRPGRTSGPLLFRQETILTEAARRIRRYLGLSQEKRTGQPLIVVVPKFDLWESTSGISLDQRPYVQHGSNGILKVDMARIEKTSDAVRESIARFSPEYVAAAENLSERVRYIPVSSLGRSPEYICRDNTAFYGIRPKDVSPKWVTVPLLYCLAKWAAGTIQAHRADGDSPLDLGVPVRSEQS